MRQIERMSFRFVALALLTTLNFGCKPKAAESEKANALQPDSGMCTMDAKKCDDGSFVSRDPDHDCEFKNCPEK